MAQGRDDLGGAHRIEPRGRLVEEQHLGVGEQLHRDRRPLALAARQRAHPDVGPGRQIQPGERLVDGPLELRAGPGQAQAGGVQQRAAEGELSMDDVVLGDDADPAGAGQGVGGRAVGADAGRAAGRPAHPGHDVEQGGLAGAASAGDGRELPGGERQAGGRQRAGVADADGGRLEDDRRRRATDGSAARRATVGSGTVGSATVVMTGRRSVSAAPPCCLRTIGPPRPGHATPPPRRRGRRSPSPFVIVVRRRATGLSCRAPMTSTSAVIVSPGRTGAR